MRPSLLVVPTPKFCTASCTVRNFGGKLVPTSSRPYRFDSVGVFRFDSILFGGRF